jgi:hypothetical protein
MIDAVVYDFGGVFMASPFEAIRRMSEDKGAEFEETLAIVFGPYAEDTDHPWHRRARRAASTPPAPRSSHRRGRATRSTCTTCCSTSAAAAGWSAMVDNVRRVRRGSRPQCSPTSPRAATSGGPHPARRAVRCGRRLERGRHARQSRIYRYTLTRLGGVAPERTAFLDDFDGNVAAANALGMLGHLVEVDPTGAIAEVDALLARLG